LTLEEPTRTMRGREDPMTVISARRTGSPGASMTAWSCSSGAASGGRYGEDRCGRWRGSRAWQPHPQGLRPKDASEAAAQRRRDPGDPAADDRSPAALLTPGCSRLLASPSSTASWLPAAAGTAPACTLAPSSTSTPCCVRHSATPSSSTRSCRPTPSNGPNGPARPDPSQGAYGPPSNSGPSSTPPAN
jgi:hypothetical protein